jgi:cell division protein FtsB
MVTSSKLSVSKAATDFGVSRQTIYKYFKNGTLSKNDDGTVDASEMIRVFGEKKKTVSTVQSESVIVDSGLQRENDSLRQQIEQLVKQLDDYKNREKWLMQQIEQLQPKLIEHNKKGFLSRIFG